MTVPVSRRATLVLLVAVLVSSAVGVWYFSSKAGADLPDAVPLATPLTYFDGDIRLEPPGAATPAVSAAAAFADGFRNSPYVSNGLPDKVVLARFSDDSYGDALSTTTPSPAATPKSRARTARELDSRQGSRDRRVRPYFQDRLAWVFLFVDRPHVFSGVGVVQADFAVVTDAGTGEFLRAFAEPHRGGP
jgi:hypothetical protein